MTNSNLLQVFNVHERIDVQGCHNLPPEGTRLKESKKCVISQAEAVEGEQQNCANSVQKLVWRLKISQFGRKCSARTLGLHLLVLSSKAFIINKGKINPHLVVRPQKISRSI